MRKTNLFFFSLLLFLFASEAFAADPIVYSRCKRTTESFTITADVPVGGVQTSSSRTFPIMDGYDVMPDVKNFFTDISAPCDLIYRDASGVETVIYDCSTTGSTVGQASCAALDAQVSPDGTKIAFSVFRGTLGNFLEAFDARTINPNADAGYLIPGDVGNYHTLPNKRLIVSGAELMYRNMTAGTNHTILPYTVGTWDSGPTFLTNSRVAFTSTRDGHSSTMIFRTTTSRTGTRIWSVDLDGKNLSLDSHHSLSQEQHPFMLKNGRVAYSSWQILGGLPFRHNNGTSGSSTTDQNLFQIFMQYPDGSENFALCCMHSGDHTPSHYGEDHNAAHFLTQTTDERIWFADYYRGNNQGLGAVIGVMEESMIEGFGRLEVSGHEDLFAPRDAINLASWAVNSDNSGTITVAGVSHPNYAGLIPWYGKLGHPFAMTSNGLGVVWGKGNCSIVTNHLIFSELGLGTQPPVSSGNGSGSYANHMYLIGRDIPACDLGIYKTTTIPSSHPSDLSVIVDTEEWHELFPRVVLPYQDIYGVPSPKVHPVAHIRSPHWALTPGEPFGLLGAASIIDRETAPFGGITFQNGAHPEHQFNLAGTDTIDYTDDELCGVRLLGMLPNRSISNTHAEINNVWGERTSILGELHVKHYDGQGNRILNPLGDPDTSFLVKLPANVPHITQAIDCDGRTLNTDQSWQTVKPGEIKTCGGCHVHSREPELEFHRSYAATTNYTIPVLGKGTVPLLNGKTGNAVNVRTENAYGLRITLQDDIKPIFDARCISCHGDVSPAAGLNLSNTSISDGYTTTGSTWFCLVRDYTQSCVPADKKVNVEGMYGGTQFRRPQLTKYMRAMNSRGSLLLWKAANQRLDNRTDGQDAQDINFGADHPTTITAEELGILSRWIDLGAPAGPQELKDTQKPTLHMAATVANNEITKLLIGTVDLGAGINPATLNVCLVSGGTCGSNLAGTAEMHGIATINLGTPISDSNQVIRATVSDAASPANTTQIEYTAGYLMSVALNGNPDIEMDEETDRVVNIVAAEGSRVFLSGYPRGSVFDELTRTLRLRPDFTQSGVYTIVVTEIDGLGVETNSSFTLTVNDTIQPVDPVVTDTIDYGTFWELTVRYTTDTWLDVPGLAGRTLDYKVRIPKSASPANKMPLDIYFHGHGSPSAFIGGGADKYGVGPYDPVSPGSWHTGNYSGYPSAYVAGTHTFENTAQRRILQTIDWIDRNYPGRDPDKTNARGSSMGGSGATFFAIRYPYIVSEVHENMIGMTIMRNSGNAYVDSVIVPFWGSRTNPPMMNDTGINAFDFYDLARALRDDPRVRDIQWQTAHGVNDGTIIFNHINTASSYTGESFFEAAQAYGANARIFWDQRGHSGGEVGLVGWWYGALPTNSKSKHSLVHAAFSNSSIDDVPPTWNGSAFVGGTDRGAVNRFLAWNSDSVVDEYNALSIPVYVRTDNPAQYVGEGLPLSGDGYTGVLPITADVTIRRAQKFRLLPFETVNYVYGAASGTVTANADGEITLTGLAINSTQTTIQLSRSLLSTPATINVTAGGNATITEGDTFSRTITFTDGEDNDAAGRTYSIDWCGTNQSGSVSAGNFSFNISRLFSTAGSCLVTVTVTDGTGEFDAGSFTITINEAGPAPAGVVISVGGAGLVREGGSYSRVISFTDGEDSGGDGWTYSCNVDGGTPATGSIPAGTNSFTFTHVYPNGDYLATVTCTVTDTGGDEDTASFNILVRNTPPIAAITGNSTATAGVSYSITLDMSDFSGDDALISYDVDWGDGTVNSLTSHTYSAAGLYTINIIAFDNDGIWIAGQKHVRVSE